MKGRSVASVLKGLACCSSDRGRECCIGCPYAFMDADNCGDELMKDAKEAIEYLLASRPRESRRPSVPPNENPRQDAKAQPEQAMSHEELMRGLMDGDITREAFLGAWNGTGG